ncbi:MAG: hypothetical protein ABI402_06300 [Ferruginibacter sp.]
MIKKLKHALKETLVSYKKIDLLHQRELNDYKHSKVNLGQIQATLNNQKPKIKELSEVEFQVFSQFGDDGIIQYLVNKLPLKNKTFIEFGVENYREANTRFLLISNYWSGVVIDGSEENVQAIKNESMYGYFDLRAKQSFITKENIDNILKDSGFNKELAILSIDIDGNDYWVWKAITSFEPDIIICEYNCLFGFEDAITIEYDPAFVRGKKTPFNFYGISLKAAQQIASERGYFFIGCNSAGNNAYFIHNKFRSVSPIEERSAEAGYNFSVFSESRKNGEQQRGMDKIRSIDGLNVIDVNTMEVKKIDAERIIQSLVRANKFRGIH